MPRNPDPKHGRWILPVIIVAMVVLTITFVSSLEPAEQEAGTTTTLPPPSTTTTTTLPTDVAAFLVTLDVYETQVTAFQADVAAINGDWEDSLITFDQARSSFEEVRAAITAWEDQVAGAADVPSELAEAHVELVVEVEKLAPAVADIVAGLEAPDDGTLRRQGVAAFDDQVVVIIDAIDAVRERAETTGTTTGEVGETTTSSAAEEPTTSLTASTTVPTDTTAFRATLDDYRARATAFRNDVALINTDWEAGRITYDDAHGLFEEARVDIVVWAAEVTGTTDVPAQLVVGHAELAAEVEKLAPGVQDIIAGLEASDDGALRRAAVSAFDDQITIVLEAIDALRA